MLACLLCQALPLLMAMLRDESGALQVSALTLLDGIITGVTLCTAPIRMSPTKPFGPRAHVMHRRKPPPTDGGPATVHSSAQHSGIRAAGARGRNCRACADLNQPVRLRYDAYSSLCVGINR
jgi:hypothetical protein